MFDTEKHQNNGSSTDLNDGEERVITTKSKTCISSQILRDFFGGIAANIVGTFVAHPLDTVKVRMQLSYSKETIYGAAKKIFTNEGFRGFYKGVCSPLFGELPFGTTVFVTNDFCKRALRKYNLSDNRANFYAGVISGFANTFFTGPIEFLKIK